MNKKDFNYDLNLEEHEELIQILKKRFDENKHRHEKVKWQDVESRLRENKQKMWSLYQMELTGGEPDLITYDEKEDNYIYCDFSKETPKNRRSMCYDKAALDSRKTNKPRTSAIETADAMGVSILDETFYRKLQDIEAVDLKTSSWVKTPEKIRKLGGALFCDRRYDTVFLYHNGAESYYAARGFRAILII